MKIVVIGTVASAILGFRRGLIEEMVRNGHEVYAFAIDYSEASAAQVRGLGANPVKYALSRGGMTPFSDIANTIRLSRHFRRISPDVVFSFFSKPVVFSTIAAVIAGVKRKVGMLEGLGSAFTEHPTGISLLEKLMKSVQVFLYRVSFRFLDCIVFLNKDDPVDLLGEYSISTRRMEVLGGIGLDLNFYQYSVAPTDPVVFIFVGRLIAEKGVGDFIAAARIVRKKFPDSKFVVLGSLDSVSRRGISAEYMEKCVNDGLIFHPGHVSDVVDWISRSSVFVLPSYYREGVPRSTQEAMAIGRPIISTDVPGCRDTVVEGENGFLVPKWRPDKLAEKMIYFCENKEKINEMGRNSRALAQVKFDALLTNSRLLRIVEGV